MECHLLRGWLDSLLGGTLSSELVRLMSAHLRIHCALSDIAASVFSNYHVVSPALTRADAVAGVESPAHVFIVASPFNRVYSEGARSFVCRDGAWNTVEHSKSLLFRILF